MGFFKKKTHEVRADTEVTPPVENILLTALFGKTEITKEEVKQIPEVAACIDYIAGTVAGLPLKLYRQNNGSVEEIKEDRRAFLLNHDTGDTLTAKQFWRSIIEDYYLEKGGYAYIHKQGMEYRSIHYVEAEKIQILKNEHPVFKDFDIYVHNRRYFPFEFAKFLRKTKDGCTSKSLIEENKIVFGVAYQTMAFEENLIKKGGNKKGFIKSGKKLSKEAMTQLKGDFKKLYSNNKENVVVLNEGMDFKEASNTSVEMQLNENKKANAEAITGIFKIPYSLLYGNGTKEQRENFIRFCITPLLEDLECSLDRDLLTEKEKKTMYFAFDTKELTRGSVEERYKAYEIGLKNNFLQVDEVRDKEDLEPLNVSWIKLGLDCVLYDPKTDMVYTPNTNETKEMGQKLLKGEGDENRDQE